MALSSFAAGDRGAEVALHRWSGDLNVPDPVACTVDDRGRVYVSATTRRKVADLDIREHPMWIAADVGLSSVAEKRAFYRRELAPGKMQRPRGGLADHNGDGSIDWRDLTVHTERIYQLRDTDGDGTADAMTVFAEGFNTDVTGIAAGVLWHDGWLYATIAPDLWRLKDTDDDGVADVREVVAHGFGLHIAYAGHDMHGLSVGPDGRIYWSIGDKGAHVTSKEGRTFSFPNVGAVFRAEPDGSNFEVYAYGLRNPQEPAFDAWGDLFVVDNDADMEGERERLVYIAEGSDSGWRCSYQYMGLDSPWMREGLWREEFPGQAAYLLPPLEHISDGPAGFRFEPGTALGEAQRNLFILTEFPAGRISGLRIEPAGASFRLAEQRVLSTGVMGIGLSWHPDGSLMMADWIGGYPLDELGAVWQVDTTGPVSPLRAETSRILARGAGSIPTEALRLQLSHADQRVRLQAQFELVKRGEANLLLTLAREEVAPLLPRVHALWGYGQLLRQGQVEAEPLRPLLAAESPELRRQTLKILGDVAAVPALAEAVMRGLRDESPRVRYQAAITLGKWRVSAATVPLLEMAERDADEPVLRHAVVFGLAGCAEAEAMVAQVQSRPVSVRQCGVVALRRQRSPLVAAFLDDSDQRVVEEAARAIHDDESIPEALPALADRIDADVASDVVWRRAINAAFRLGTKEAAHSLLALALNETAPKAKREEALAVLAQWTEPPPLDRIDGWARELEPVRIQEILTHHLEPLLALPEDVLQALALRVVLAHDLEPRVAQINRVLGNEAAPGALRAQAFRLLARRHRADPDFPRALATALAPGSSDSLFAEALLVLRQDDPTALVAQAREAFDDRSVPIQQQLLRLLAEAADPAADVLLAEKAQALLRGEVAPELQLDLLEALKQRGESREELAAARELYAATAAAAARRELLAGGSVAAGREIALNHLGANCVACHRFESSDGSNVGPSLRNIGRERDAVHLLESLIAPGAQLAPGYGFVSVTLRDGESVHGGLVAETTDAISVRLLDGTVQTVARSRVEAMTPPMSIMPPMDGILTDRELRDLVAYLQTLRGEPKKQSAAR